MAKYKNVILIFISLVLFAYAAFISIIPAMIAKSFNKDKFSKDMQAAIGLNVTFDNLDIRIKPDFETVVTVSNLDVKFPDNQPVLTSEGVELTTTPAFLFSNKMDIKNLLIRHVKYDELILPDGQNKIAFIPSVFTPKYIGKNNLTIIAGPTKIKDIKISHTTTKVYSYNETYTREINMSASELKDYLNSLGFKNVKIK